MLIPEVRGISKESENDIKVLQVYRPKSTKDQQDAYAPGKLKVPDGRTQVTALSAGASLPSATPPPASLSFLWRMTSTGTATWRSSRSATPSSWSPSVVGESSSRGPRSWALHRHRHRALLLFWHRAVKGSLSRIDRAPRCRRRVTTRGRPTALSYGGGSRVLGSGVDSSLPDRATEADAADAPDAIHTIDTGNAAHAPRAIHTGHRAHAPLKTHAENGQRAGQDSEASTGCGASGHRDTAGCGRATGNSNAAGRRNTPGHRNASSGDRTTDDADAADRGHASGHRDTAGRGHAASNSDTLGGRDAAGRCNRVGAEGARRAFGSR